MPSNFIQQSVSIAQTEGTLRISHIQNTLPGAKTCDYVICRFYVKYLVLDITKGFRSKFEVYAVGSDPQRK